MRIHAIFDGEVLRPEEPSSLEANKRYVLTIEDDSGGEVETSQHILARLAEMATDLGVADLAERHDDYSLGR
jgi:hypothetical protein